MVDQNNDIMTVRFGEPVQAKLNVTYLGNNGDLPDLIQLLPNHENASTEDKAAWALRVKTWTQEAIRTGGIPGIQADPTANLTDFVVDAPCPPTEVRPYHLVQIRPKTPFGRIS